MSSHTEFGEMFGGFLTEHDGQTFVVDCGVGGGAKDMVQRLKKELGTRPLDYVLLTHIHMDHAGATDEIMRVWPHCKTLAHKKSLRHLENPEKLWASTQAVMGELAEMYGRLEPLDPARLIAHTENNIPGLTIIETPGHAPHHLSFRLGETLFPGEASGCPYVLNGRIYGRPATPPRYFPAATLTSIDRLLEEPDCQAYFAHAHTPLPLHYCLNRYKKQLALWDKILRNPESVRQDGESEARHLERLLDVLFSSDENLIPINALPSLEQQGEKYLMRNSVKGFLEYYKTEAGAAS